MLKIKPITLGLIGIAALVTQIYSVSAQTEESATATQKKTTKGELAPFMLEGTFKDEKIENMAEAPARFRISSPNSAREGVLELFGDGLYCKYTLNLVVPQPSFFQLHTLRFQGDRADCKPDYPMSVRGVINLDQAKNLGQIRLINERLKKECALTVKTAIQR